MPKRQNKVRPRKINSPPELTIKKLNRVARLAKNPNRTKLTTKELGEILRLAPHIEMNGLQRARLWAVLREAIDEEIGKYKKD